MAKGSHATLGGWEPKECEICGQPVRVTTQNCWYYHHHDPEFVRSWHTECIRNNGGLARTLSQHPAVEGTP